MFETVIMILAPFWLALRCKAQTELALADSEGLGALSMRRRRSKGVGSLIISQFTVGVALARCAPAKMVQVAQVADSVDERYPQGKAFVSDVLSV